MIDQGSLDFETYSAAGAVWSEATRKWSPPKGARKKGLSVVGTHAYAEHPSTEVLTLSYRLPGHTVIKRWRPGDPLPQDMFDAFAAGGVFKAHNVFFEFCIWEVVCTAKYGWPSLMPWRYQFRCTMATARVNSLPGGLGPLSEVLKLPTPKDADGTRLLDKFSVPRNPTKADPRWRITPRDPGEEADGAKLEAYCDTDTVAEGQAAERMTPMSPDELLFWWIDQEINWRGIAIDREGVRNCLAVLEQAFDRYGAEFRAITGGLEPTQLQATAGWLAAQGVFMPSMDEEALDAQLAAMAPHPPGGIYPARRVLEIRQLIGSAGVKKLYAMENAASSDNRLRNLIIHHGARTGRPTGDLVQPLNLPREGPSIRWCDSAPCSRPFRHDAPACPWCAHPANPAWKTKWSGRPKALPATAPQVVDVTLELMASHSLELVEYYLGDAVDCMGGCLRGLFVAGPGMELIASDYSAIEAVVTAALAGEEWRLQVMREGKDIYLAAGKGVTGVSYEDYMAYKDQHGEHHPDRQKVLKVAELACGFAGWTGALRAFGYDGSDDDAKQIVLRWRAASPKIVEMWGGQFRGAPWDRDTRQEYFGFEGCAVQAILYPGVPFVFNGIRFEVRPHPAGWSALIVTLLSGRELTYHNPQLHQATREYSRPGEYAITYWTHNSNPKYGAMGWVPMSTFGGRLTENIVQATAHDIQRHSIIKLRAAGYPVVLHVYDENVVEVPLGAGSVEEVERIMSDAPAYAAGWPIKAAGGWRQKRYKKS